MYLYIFISTGGRLPRYAIFPAMKNLCIWDEEKAQNIDLGTW